MSGRRLGRLCGSLLLLVAAAATIAGFHTGRFDGVGGGYQATDIIWTIGTESAAVDSGR